MAYYGSNLALFPFVFFLQIAPSLPRDRFVPLVPDGDAVARAKLLGAVLKEAGRTGDDAARHQAAAVAVNLKEKFNVENRVGMSSES